MQATHSHCSEKRRRVSIGRREEEKTSQHSGLKGEVEVVTEQRKKRRRRHRTAEEGEGTGQREEEPGCAESRAESGEHRRRPPGAEKTSQKSGEDPGEQEKTPGNRKKKLPLVKELKKTGGASGAD